MINLQRPNLISLTLKKINIRIFSSTASKYMESDNGKTADEVNTNAGSDDQETEETNINTDSQPGSANISDDGSGYETNPDRPHLDEAGEAMYEYPAEYLTEDKLK